MLSFATEFPVAPRHGAATFLEAILTWISGSPHTILRAQDLGGMVSEEAWSGGVSKEAVESLQHVSGSSESAAVKYVRRDDQLEWTTVVAFSKEVADSWVSISVSCEADHPTKRLPPAKKPVLVRTLLDQLGGAIDGELTVGRTPHRLGDVDIELAARLITGLCGCRLPVVYVSAQFHGRYAVDVDQLARDLAGLAHVIVEPNRPFSFRLKIDVESENVYGGTIGVYWPDGRGRRAFFASAGQEGPDDLARAIVEEVRSALANRRPTRRCTWAAVQEAVSQRRYAALKASGSKEIDRYIDAFDEDMKAKDQELDDAEREIARLKSEVRKLEARSPMGSGVGLRTGREQDLYPGELVGIIRDSLEDAATRVSLDSRRGHVLAAILESTEAGEIADVTRERLKSLLRGARTIDSKARRELEDMGFTVTEDGKHFKLVFQGDDRYTFSLPKSGSDHRGGLNAAGDIARLLL
jgi:hypothetical protein